MVRHKSRYIVVEVNPTDLFKHVEFRLDRSSFKQTILDVVQQMHGDFGVAATRNGLIARYCNSYTRVGFIRVRHGPHVLVTSAIPFVKKMSGVNVAIRTLYTGATMLKCYKFLQHYQRGCLIRMWSLLRTEEEKQKVERAVMDLHFKEFSELEVSEEVT